MKKIFIFILIALVLNIYGDAVTGLSPSNTYKRLLFLESNEITLAYKELADGNGNVCPFEFALAKILIRSTNELQFTDGNAKIYASSSGIFNLIATSELIATSPTITLTASSGVDVSNDMTINGTTASSSYTTGALVVDGGVGIAEDLYINDDLDVDGDTSVDVLTVDTSVDCNVTTFDIDATDDIDIDTSDTTGGIDIGINTSGVPINIGHSTSEVDIGDNLTVGGNFAVTGTSIFTGQIAGNITSIGASSFSSMNCLAGTINNTPIGATTPSTGEFTTIEASGTTTLNNYLYMNGNKITVDDDDDTYIAAPTDDIIEMATGGVVQYNFKTGYIYPETTNNIDLGISGSAEFKDIYLAGDVDCGDDIIVGDDANITGLATIGETLTVTGIITAEDDIVVDDDATITGAVTVGDTLGVTGIATFTDDIIVGDLISFSEIPETVSIGTISADYTCTDLSILEAGTESVAIDDGLYNNQIKYIVTTSDAGGGAIAISLSSGSNLGFTSIVFGDIGDGCTLKWSVKNDKWFCVGVAGAVITIP